VASFAHLHVASSYSLRYGLASPGELAGRAASLGMDILALTDRDGLYGAVKHVRACHAASVGPVVGADLRTGERERAVFLAEGRVGWGSLCRLVSAAHLGDSRGEPMVADESFGPGLVVLLGPSSDVGRALAERREDVAAGLLRRWRSRAAAVVIELVDHRRRGDAALAARMLAFARRQEVPAVLSNAVRYLDRADQAAAQVLDAARLLRPLERRHLDDTTGRAFLTSDAQMRAIAEQVCGPEAGAVLAATRALAERCVLDPFGDLGMGRAHLPEAPGGRLAARCAAGLVRRGLDGSAAARDRLYAELGVIGRKGLAPYFLVVADITELIRSRGIRCAIRGSGAGSLVNYLLGIGDVDPLANGLLMERFLADSRPGLPDIDLDVESARRLEVYRAVFERYGAARVATVSMMETYRARSAIRDVGRALGLAPLEIDAVAKTFPHIRARQIRAALDDLPELRHSNLGQARLDGLFRLAERLDGLPRHIAMHPCGLVLSNVTLRDRTPVESSMLGFPMSQFDKHDVEAMGLLKLDVLGVRMQSALAHAVAEIGRTTGERVVLEALPHDDQTFALVRSARTLGCFQIESPGQRELVAKLLPRTMDDLVIDISLFRPGPVGADMITPFLQTRHGRRALSVPHPDLAPALAESAGVVVFHEQVIRIIDIMTGCGLSEAEAARRRLAADDGRETTAAWFREGAQARGYDRFTVERVWRMLAAFGAFGFCKAHAASFALPTYQSAWLKRHHPAAFFAGVLTHEPGMYPKRVLLDDARRSGVAVLPLDVNRSSASWRVEGRGLRVPLTEVKGIHAAEVERIIASRPYRSLGELWRRARVSRPVGRRLVLAGGLDALYGIRVGAGRTGTGQVTRRDLLSHVNALARVTGPEGQLELDGIAEPSAGGLREFSPAEAIEAELEVLGMDVSGHVLGFYDSLLAVLGVVRARDLVQLPAGAEVLVAGVKVATQTPAVRSGQRIIFATVEDGTGPVDAAFFESVQEWCAPTVFGAWLLLIRGTVRRPGGLAVSVTGQDCWDLAGLHRLWRREGLEAVRRVLAVRRGPGERAGGRPLVYASGFELSPYADIGPAGGNVGRVRWNAGS
jgi:error-prone DNA polymerase